MAVEMTPRVLNGIARLDLQGALTAEAAIRGGSLPAAVAQLTRQGFREIAVNLAAVTRLDACGLGELVRALRLARDHGARLTLVAPPPRVRRMLAVTRLDTVFEMNEGFGPFGSFGPFACGRWDRSADAATALEADGLGSALAV